MWDAELFLLSFLPFVLVAGIWLFLRTDECWDEYRQTTGFKVFTASIVIIAFPLTLWWADYVWNNTEKRSQVHLETARNYENDGNKEKALEYAIKAYESNHGSSKAIAYLGYVFWVQGHKDAFVKGRDILASNSSRLDATGKAALGVLEFALKNPRRSFQALGTLDLSVVAEYMLPWAVAALAYGALRKVW